MMEDANCTSYTDPKDKATNFRIKALIKAPLSNGDTPCCPNCTCTQKLCMYRVMYFLIKHPLQYTFVDHPSNHLELCTSLPLNWGHLSIQERQLGPVLAAVERSTVLHHVKYSRVQ